MASWLNGKLTKWQVDQMTECLISMITHKNESELNVLFFFFSLKNFLFKNWEFFLKNDQMPILKKTFFRDTDAATQNKLECLSLTWHSVQRNVCTQSQVFRQPTLKVGSSSLITRLARKDMRGTNTLVYYFRPSVTDRNVLQDFSFCI
jgi:hypothetical protein